MIVVVLLGVSEVRSWGRCSAGWSHDEVVSGVLGVDVDSVGSSVLLCLAEGGGDLEREPHHLQTSCLYTSGEDQLLGLVVLLIISCD